MIEFAKFKELFNLLEGEPEIEIYFNNRESHYMIIKYDNYINFQRCGINDRSGEIKYNNLDELYNIKTIDNIILKDEWNNIKDIIIDETFSIIEDKEIINKNYKINL